GLATPDGPAVVAGPALVPPAVEHGAVDHPVHGRLHATGARRLERPAGVVEPDIHALDQVASDADVVVLHHHHAALEPLRAAAREYLLDDTLARAVGRVCLAREHDLDGPLLVPQQACQPFL